MIIWQPGKRPLKHSSLPQAAKRKLNTRSVNLPQVWLSDIISREACGRFISEEATGWKYEKRLGR